MTQNKFRIASRGSKLALIQTQKVLDSLQSFFPRFFFEITVVKTQGDRLSSENIAVQASVNQGVFTKEVSEAVADGRADFAVHSAKDLPTQLLPALRLAAFLKRDDPRDAWISRGGVPFTGLRPGAAVATGSPRRKAQLARLRPDVKVIEIRGNVPTRLEKMRGGEADGLILAACGLQRLGLAAEITEIFEPGVMLPAVGQGAIAVEVRAASPAEELCGRLNDAETSARIEAERSLLHAVQGGCQIPVGANSRVEGRKLFLEAAVFSLDGRRQARAAIEGETRDAAALGEGLAGKLKRDEGREILEEIRKQRQVPLPEH